MTTFVKYWLPVVGWMFLMFGWSTDLMSAEHTSRFLEPFLRWLSPDISNATIALIHLAVRKAAHLSEYAVLAVFLARLISFQLSETTGILPLVVAFVCAVAFAAADEFHQSFVPSRTASGYDVAIDSFGAIVGVIIYDSLARRVRRSSRTRSRDAAERS